MSSVLAFTVRLAFGLAVCATGLWGAGALFYQVQGAHTLRLAACGAWAAWVLGIAVMAFGKWAAPALAAYALTFALMLLWWSNIAPSNNRDWADDVAQFLHSSIDGDMITLENVRNFDWRSDADYTARWESRRYDLRRLRSADLGLSYWMGPAIAHTLVSFGFDNGQGSTEYVTFSIEIRKERHESFSAMAGFFKRYELSLVAADERDVLRVRTNVRGEDVYLYRLAMPQPAMRSLFLAYLNRAGELGQQPRFYNTLTANCTTIVFQMAQHIVGGLPLDWRLLASGYLPQYLRDIHGLAARGELAGITAAGRITERAHAADGRADFSQAIRQGLPGAAEVKP